MQVYCAWHGRHRCCSRREAYDEHLIYGGFPPPVVDSVALQLAVRPEAAWQASSAPLRLGRCTTRPGLPRRAAGGGVRARRVRAHAQDGRQCHPSKHVLRCEACKMAARARRNASTRGIPSHPYPTAANRNTGTYLLAESPTPKVQNKNMQTGYTPALDVDHG
eukprot:COSAG02_NODE_1125_length_14435_cov_97.039411_8_plen_163_part_00